MLTRSAMAGTVAGAVAGVGVLLVIALHELITPIDCYGSGGPTFGVAAAFVAIGLIPAVLVGSAFGLFVLTPYAYVRQRFTLGLASDVLALLIAALLWSLVQDAAGELKSRLENFGLIAAVSLPGLLPLRWLTSGGKREASGALSPASPLR